MKKIALTGPTGCGKGFVSEIIQSKYRLPCLDCDAVVHGLYESDTELISKIGLLFGNDIIVSGTVDRNKLANAVFSDKEKLGSLNALVHKSVGRYVDGWFSECAEKGCSAAFIDAPLLFEAGMDKSVDLTICVVASPVIRMERIMLRDGIGKDSALGRINNQMSNEEYISRSDHLIINEGNEDVIEQLDGILREEGII